MTDSATQATEVWFQHPRCGAVFQDFELRGECIDCTGRDAKVSLTRHEFAQGSPEFVEFLVGARRVYATNRWAEISDLVALASVAPKTASP